MLKKCALAIFVAGLLMALYVSPATASDHLLNAAQAPGATIRGFSNPVAGNPSGMSGAKAMPGTVPGEGNPNAGDDRGTPSVDLTLVNLRSGGHGWPQH